jgi:hypothetical protein
MTSRIQQFRRRFAALAAAATIATFAAFSSPAQADTQLCPDVSQCVLTHVSIATTKSKDGTTTVTVTCFYTCNAGNQYAAD